MSATIFFAKEKNSNRVYHIDEVNKLDNLKFKCTGCDEEMIVVKTEARKKDWHFRHSVESECQGEKDNALHDLAVQILMESNEIAVSKEIKISYSNPRKEISVFNYRSDVAVDMQGEEVHFEI